MYLFIYLFNVYLATGRKSEESQFYLSQVREAFSSK